MFVFMLRTPNVINLLNKPLVSNTLLLTTGTVLYSRSSENSFLLKYLDFPGGPVVKNPLSNAGDEGSIPDQGIKIPQLPLSCGATKPTPQKYWAYMH